MQNKKQILIFAGSAVLLLIFMGMRQIMPVAGESGFAYTAEEQKLQVEEMTELEMPEQDTAEIVVHVAGAVQKPGVYTLQQGNRIEDALKIAGAAEDADIDALNRAALLTDGQKIVVPYKDASASSGNETIVDDGMVNLNQASLQQLMTLPGIGEVKAQAILDYRVQHGTFSSIEEIQQVNGIGAAIYSQIKNKIKI